jgi:hypothetical protein
MAKELLDRELMYLEVGRGEGRMAGASGPGSGIGLYFRIVGTHALGMVPLFHSCTLSHGVLVRFLRFRLEWLPSFAHSYWPLASTSPASFSSQLSAL